MHCSGGISFGCEFAHEGWLRLGTKLFQSAVFGKPSSFVEAAGRRILETDAVGEVNKY